jgi:superfamily II DNA/RNA helicase
MTAEIISSSTPSIVFTRTRRGAERVARQLTSAGVRAESIHGGRSQGQRTRALAAFSSGRVAALVATDVAARGIHVKGVASVVHYDLPDDPKDYLHRSGRTARAGLDGVVVSLVSPDQRREVQSLQRSIGLDHVTHDPAADWLTGSSGSRLTDVPANPQRAPKARSNGNGRRHNGGQSRSANAGGNSRNGNPSSGNRSNGNRSNGNRNGSGNRNRSRNGNGNRSQRSG